MFAAKIRRGQNTLLNTLKNFSPDAQLYFIRFVFIAVGFILPFASRGLVIVFALFAITIFLIAFKKINFQSFLKDRLVIIGALFCVYLAVTSLWSDHPQQSLATAFRLITLILLFAVAAVSVKYLARPELTSIAKSILIGLSISIALFVIEFLAGYPLTYIIKGTDNNHHALINLRHALPVATAIIIPMIAIYCCELKKYKFVIFYFSLFLLFLLIKSIGSASLTIAIILSVLASPILIFKRDALFRAFLCFFIVFTFAFPVMSQLDLDHPVLEDLYKDSKPSFVHRLHIYQYSTALALQKPLTGHGFDMARHIGEKAPSISRERFPYLDEAQIRVMGSLLPLHPHSIAAQLWLELGLIGVVLWSAIFYLGAMRIYQMVRDNRMISLGYFMALTTVFCIMNLSFGAWQNWWVAGVFISILSILIQAPTTLKKQENEPPSAGV